MNILVLAKQFPYPLHDGASIAIHMLCRGLVNAGAMVDLISFNTTKHFYDGPVDIDELAHYRDIELVPLDNLPTALGGLLNLFSKESYHVSRFYSEEMKKRITEKLSAKHYDVVQIESSHLLVYLSHIRSYFNGRIVLRAHNIEHVIWKRHSQTLSHTLYSWYHGLQADRFKQFEDQMVREVDQILTVSEHDAIYFRGLNSSTYVTPIGIEINSIRVSPKLRKPVYGFIGSMDWLPNHTGLRWFLDHVWIKISVEATLIVAGRGSQLYECSDRRVKVLGEVCNADDFWNRIDVLVVPLFSGSGTRVKIIEALSRSKLVLSTSIGIEGIPAKDGVEAFIRDGVEAWTEAIIQIYKQWSNYKFVSEAGFSLASDKYDYNNIAATVYGSYQNP